jgi:hypothetical protein
MDHVHVERNPLLHIVVPRLVIEQQIVVKLAGHLDGLVYMQIDMKLIKHLVGGKQHTLSLIESTKYNNNRTMSRIIRIGLALFAIRMFYVAVETIRTDVQLKANERMAGKNRYNNHNARIDNFENDSD